MTGLVNVALKGASINFDPATLGLSGRVVGINRARHDFVMYFGGAGVISGVVKIGTVPARRKVRLYEANTGVLLREILANTDGTYQFDQLRPNLEFTVSSTDDQNTYNDVIAARVKAV